MKSLPALRLASYTIALVTAFVSGWALHTSQPPDSPAATVSALHRRLELETTHGTVSKVGTARPAPASRAVTLAGEIESLDARGALAALHALDLPGASAGTPLERHLLIERFAAQDPLTALTYIDTLPAGDRAAAAATVMSAWAAQNPEAAAAHLEAEVGGFDLSENAVIPAATAVASEWSRHDPRAAAAWAASLPDELRAGALAVATGKLAATDPASARQFMEALPDSGIRAEAAAPLAAQWAAADPVPAATWAMSLSTIQEKTAALSGVTSAWMASDPSAASQWVNSLPAGPAKDAAIAALASASSIRNDPDAAAVWAQTISSPAARESLLTGIHERLRVRDSLR